MAEQAAPSEERLGLALAAMWQAIRAAHPEVPAAAPIVAAPGRAGGYRAGALSSRYPRENALREGAEATLVALLREAAHELGAAKGVKTMSASGRHNTRFRDLAEHVGLQVAEHDPTRPGGGSRGWSRLALPETTAETYRAELDQLADALAQQPPPEPAEPTRGRGGRKTRATCACPRTIYSSTAELNTGGIRCDYCGQPFTAG